MARPLLNFQHQSYEYNYQDKYWVIWFHIFTQLGINCGLYYTGVIEANYSFRNVKTRFFSQLLGTNFKQ